MRSGLIARILLTLGFLAAMVSLDSWIATRTVMDTAATKGMAASLLADPIVQHNLGDEVAKQVNEQLGSKPNDPRLAAASEQAVRDPRVQRAFANALGQAHAALLGTGGRVVVIDAGTLTRAVHEALARHDPQAAARLAGQKPLKVKLDLSKAPTLGHARDLAKEAIWFGLVAAMLLIGGSLLLAHDGRAIRRFGRRVAYLALGPLLVFVVLPVFLESRSGDGPAVAATVVRSYRGRVLPAVIALVATGIVIVIGTLLVKRRSATPTRSRPAEPGSPEPASPYRTAVGSPALPSLADERLYL